MSKEFEIGRKTKVLIEDGFIKIKRKGLLNKWDHGGDKDIRISSLSGVQVRKPGLRAGYIQFVFSGSAEKKSVTKAAGDQNSILFDRREYQQALAIRDYLQELISNGETGQNRVTVADELMKLKQLLDDGALTKREYDTQKQRLLGS